MEKLKKNLKNIKHVDIKYNSRSLSFKTYILETEIEKHKANRGRIEFDDEKKWEAAKPFLYEFDGEYSCKFTKPFDKVIREEKGKTLKLTSIAVTPDF